MSTTAFEQDWLEGISGDPGGGPYVILRFRFEADNVVDVDWETNGCPAAQAAACGLAAFAKGRTVVQLEKLCADDLLVLIGGLAEGKGHYATMAIEALGRIIEHRCNDGN